MSTKDYSTDRGATGSAIMGGSAAVSTTKNRDQKPHVPRHCLEVQLPTDGLDRVTATHFGLLVDGPVTRDKLWTTVRLPHGWTLTPTVKRSDVADPTDYVQWSVLCDDLGRVRALVYYHHSIALKRRAKMRWCSRYTAYAENNHWGDRVPVVHDAVTDTVIWTGAEVSCTDELSYGEADDAARKWLVTNFPKHADPAAYWNGGL